MTVPDLPLADNHQRGDGKSGYAGDVLSSVITDAGSGFQKYSNACDDYDDFEDDPSDDGLPQPPVPPIPCEIVPVTPELAPVAAAPAFTGSLQDSESSAVRPNLRSLEAWAAEAQAQLETSRSLRLGVSEQLKNLFGDARAAGLGVSEQRLNVRAAQEKVRHRIDNAEGCIGALFSRLEKIGQITQALGLQLSRVQRLHEEFAAPLRLVEARLELRSRRPAEEATHDPFQDALEQEQALLLQLRVEIVQMVQHGVELFRSLDKIKKDMAADVQKHRQGLRLDRSSRLYEGYHIKECPVFLETEKRRKNLGLDEPGQEARATARAQQLLLASRDLEAAVLGFCGDCDRVTFLFRRNVERAAAHTAEAMKQRIAGTQELKRQLEREIAETAGAKLQTEQSLQLMAQQLARIRKMQPVATNSVEQPVCSVNAQGHGTDQKSKPSGRQHDVVEELALVETSAVEAEGLLAKQHLTLHNALQLLQDAKQKSTSPQKVRMLSQLETKLIAHSEFIGDELQKVTASKIRGIALLEERHEWATGAVENLRVAYERLAADLELKSRAWTIDYQCQTLRTLKRDASVASPKRSTWQCAKPRFYAPPLDKVALEKLRAHLKAASYTGVGGRELGVVFGRFDADGSGSLGYEEVRSALRRTLKVTKSMLTDAQISSFCKQLDTDKSGAVSIGELVSFIGADSAVSQRTGKSIFGAMLDPVGLSSGVGESPRKTGQDWQNKPPRPYKPPLQPDAIIKMREKIKSAAYTGHLGRQLDVLFSRFDKDGSGQLEDEEVRQALRRSLRILPSEISDAQIFSLCALIDADNSGSVSIKELVDFIGPDVQVSARTGRKFFDFKEVPGGMIQQTSPGRTPRGVKLDPIMPA
eukprot:TRINITY_DN9599_c0_g1_i4.p1 TRINITY_DN9599_c0_g1~~TRINITY_DN9599_c0_g1_i4.p1  ORF type:complete len:871 (-),score=207.53 TRINITY_DN9599_c0_g1_i4:273-2885(-)